MQKVKEYDIAIIGAGPSGSTLAKILSKKYHLKYDKDPKILIIDRRDLDKTSDFKLSKSCGGLIAPDAQKTLAELGLGIPKNVLVGPQLFTVRVIDFDNNIDRFYQRHYINVDREKFDRWFYAHTDGCLSRLDFWCKSKHIDDNFFLTANNFLLTGILNIISVLIVIKTDYKYF